MTFDPACLFCRVVKREIPAAIVHEDENVLAFRDIAPQAPTHILVIPKTHIAKLTDAKGGDAALLGTAFQAVNGIAAKEGLADYRVVVNTGFSAGQRVFHVHFHLMAGRTFAWPPG
jgi:histidine triad (HIT) family protein